jgi:hypothetical protein
MTNDTFSQQGLYSIQACINGPIAFGSSSLLVHLHNKHNYHRDRDYHPPHLQGICSFKRNRLTVFYPQIITKTINIKTISILSSRQDSAISSRVNLNQVL